MSQETLNQNAQIIIERGKEVVAKGNERRFVVRKADGTEWFGTTLTIAVAVGIFMVLSNTWPLLLIAFAVGYWKKLKVEVRHDAPTLSE